MLFRDTLTRCVYGHPWMDQGYHSYCVNHRYSDNGVGSVCMAIHGWTGHVTVTMPSRDTLTRG